MALAFAALQEVGPEDSTTFLDVAGKVNVVNDQVTIGEGETATQYSVKDYVERYVWQIVRRAKQRRLPLEQEWLAIQRMIVLEHDTGRKYKGRSDAYIPMYARSRKTIVSNMTRGLFPSDDYAFVADREQGETEQSQAVKTVVEYEFEHSGLRRTIKAFLGQFSDFGISCFKVGYRVSNISKGKPGTVMDMTVAPDDGVKISTRSMFNVVVYPEWAENKRELQLEAERMEVPVSYVNDMARSKRWLNVKEALQLGAKNDEWDWVNTATLSDVASIPNTFELRGENDSPVEACTIVEAWTSIRLPKSQYAPSEDPESPLPVRIVFINGVAVLVRRNPFHHQQSPFLYARDNQIAGSFYGDGAGRLSKDLQYLANDAANQMNDCANYGMNPVALINTNYFVGTPQGIRPGAVYKGRDIDKMMKFERPPVEIIQYGQTHFQGLMSLGQDAGGAPPVLQGAKASNTATSTQVLNNNASGPLQDAVEDIEADCMVPLMEMTWELAKQYRNDTFIRKLAGGDLVQFNLKQIDGKFEFRFLSSSQNSNRQARQNGLNLFAQLASGLGPNLQAMGLMLNPTEILRRAWTDGLGFRHFDKVVVPMPMMPAAPGTPPQAGPPGPQGPGPMPAEGGPPVSAVGQGNVLPPEDVVPAPGEGDQFMPMRQDVQAQTGMPVQAQGLAVNDYDLPF